jgi:hypothetical protein
MVDAVKAEAADTSTDATGADDTGAEQINWQERAEAAEKKLVKEQKIRKDAQDAVKKAKGEIGEDGTNYKKLYEQEGAKAAKLIERQKRAEVTAAATTQLTKLGINPDAMSLALKSLDFNSVEWDEEDGVDATSVRAAVQGIKNEAGFLFEKTVNATKVKAPASGANLGSDDSTMTREAFEKLGFKERAAVMKKGTKLVD